MLTDLQARLEMACRRVEARPYSSADEYDEALEAANQPPPPRYHVPDGYVALPGDPF